MSMKTYICGRCGSRFRTEGQPKGCPVCWSESITISRQRMTSEESARYNLKIVNQELQVIKELRDQIKPHMDNYLKCRYRLISLKKSGSYHGEIPKLRK